MKKENNEKYQEFLKMRFIDRMKIIYETPESEQDEEVKNSEE